MSPGRAGPDDTSEETHPADATAVNPLFGKMETLPDDDDTAAPVPRALVSPVRGSVTIMTLLPYYTSAIIPVFGLYSVVRASHRGTYLYLL